jgi:hypothetical protein
LRFKATLIIAFGNPGKDKPCPYKDHFNAAALDEQATPLAPVSMLRDLNLSAMVYYLRPMVEPLSVAPSRRFRAASSSRLLLGFWPCRYSDRLHSYASWRLHPRAAS